MDFDIAVIGLGPAGATFAKSLNHDFKVIALDKDAPKGINDAPLCSGLLSLYAQKKLIQSNYEVPPAIFMSPQIFYAQTYDVQSGLIRNYPKAYLNLNRSEFDYWIRTLIPSHVETHYRSTCLNVERIINGYLITYLEDDEEKSFTARYIVGADGANSMVRKMRYPNHKLRQYRAYQEGFKSNHNLAPLICIYDNTLTNYPITLIQKEGLYYLNAAFPPEQAEDKYAQLKEKLSEQFEIDLSHPIFSKEGFVVYPDRWTDFYVGNEQIFLIGEAAGFLSASSMEGISYGLESAHILAEIFNKRAKKPNNVYYRKTFKLRGRLYRKVLKAKFVTTPFWRKLFMKSQFHHIPKTGSDSKL